jgi:hypothetical protein
MLQGLQICGALTNGATMNAAGTFGRFGSTAGAGAGALLLACGFADAVGADPAGADAAAPVAAARTGAVRTMLAHNNPAAAPVQRRGSPTRIGRII